jgi:sugar phosphate isomerase/epimerase
MLGALFPGGPHHRRAAIAAGGYSGIEITDTMIGGYARRPGAFASALEAHGLALVAFAAASPTGFTVPGAAAAADLEAMRMWADFTAAFPGAILSMGSATVVDAGPREEKFAVAADIYNAAGEIGRAAGVGMAVHPSSHRGTLLFDRPDYDAIFARLDPGLVGWVPDTGHILRGHPDMLDTLATYRDRIRYLHLKDVDAGGAWAMLGTGVCDVPAVVEIAAAAPRFNGWVVVEEESEAAAADPAAAVRTNRETMRRLGY